MEHLGFFGETKKFRKLNVNAYGVEFKKTGKLSMKSSETLEASNLNIESKQNSFVMTKEHQDNKTKQLQQKYKETRKQLKQLQYEKAKLQDANQKLQIIVQDKTTKLSQIQINKGKFLKQQDVIKLEQYMTSKQRQIQQLKAEVLTLKTQNQKMTIDNTLSDIQQTNSTYDVMQQKLNQLVEQCTSLRKQIQSQSEDLMHYKELLKAEKLQKQEMVGILQQKQKMIEVLIKDKQNIYQPNHSISLSCSIIEEASRNIRTKSEYSS